MVWTRIVVVLLLVPLPAAVAALAQGHAPLPDTAVLREVATDTLHDVALMRMEGGRPVIYYNPVLLQRLGPDLSRFFMAHERGHVEAGHGSGSALAGPVFHGTAVRLKQELEADCWATRTLAAAGDRDAIEAATEFFLKIGQRRHDLLHPTGAQRAAKILACEPAVVPGEGTR